MNKLPRFAGLISVILAAVIIMGVYLLVGSVDLAFVDDGNQIAYVEDVKILSDIEIPAEFNSLIELIREFHCTLRIANSLPEKERVSRKIAEGGRKCKRKKTREGKC